MKKLQRLGIVSLAALTLTAFALSNEQIVRAEGNNASETSVSDNQPVEALDETRTDEGVEEGAVSETNDTEENDGSSEADMTADDTEEMTSDGVVEEKSVSFEEVEHRFVVGDSTYDVSKVSPSGESVINKGETLPVSKLIQQRDGWEVSNVEFHAKRAYNFEKLEDLSPDSKVSYDTLASEDKPKLVIIYKPKSLAPNSPSSSVVGEGENVLKYVSTKHYLVTDEGIVLLGEDKTVLKAPSQYESGNLSYQPEYRPFDNLESIGATIFKDASRIEPFRVGDLLNHNDTTLKNQTYVNLYYKKKGDTLEANPYDLPQVEVKLRQFEVFYVDENGRNILNESEVRTVFDKVGFKSGWKKLELGPDVTLTIPVPDIKGYKARNTKMVVAYNDLSDEKVNTVRVVYDTIGDEGKRALTLRVSAWTGNHFPIFGADSRGISYNIEVKPGETVTLKPKEIEGYTPWQKDGVSITYDQLSRYFGNGYRFFYSKNNKDVPELSKMTEMLRVVHVLDDGSAPLNELVEKSTMEEVLILKYGDAPVVPTFKKIEGWQPDDMRSYVDASHVGGWTGKHGLEKGFAYQYGIETDDRRVVLIYKKAETKVEEPKESDTKPSQPTDPDTSTPADNTTGNTGTVDGGKPNKSNSAPTTDTTAGNGGTSDAGDANQTEGSANGGETSPVTPPSNNDGGKPTDPTATPTTDTTVDNGGTSDAGDAIQTEGSTNGSATSPVTPLSNDDGENPTNPIAAPTTDTTLDNGGTSDVGDDANTIAPNKPADTAIILTPITSGDVVNKDETGLVLPIVILDGKADKSTLPEADKKLVGDKGESQVKTVKKESLSRVESRHLPKTSDSHNVLAILGLAILTALGLYRPSKRKA